MFVACFCESGDLLSQWRGYGSDHGYAIEFETSVLNKSLGALEFSETSPKLAPIRYGPAAIDVAVGEVRQLMCDDQNLGHPGVHAYHMALEILSLLTTVKHPGFEEEREWRAVIGTTRTRPSCDSESRRSALPHT